MKRILSIVACALLAMTAQAQLKYGITGGLNISQIHLGDNDYKEYMNKTRPGFVVGPTAIFTIPKTPFGIDASALFDYRSARSKSTTLDTRVQCTSFQFPINLRYNFQPPEMDMVDLFVFAGPQFGVNVGNKDQYIISGTNVDGDNLERRWKLNNSVMSMNVGVGGIVMNHVLVRISYNFAFNAAADIYQVNLDKGTSRRLTSGKAHACQVVLGYLF